MEGGYSLNKFRQAQREGKEVLPPDEQEILDLYRNAREEMGHEALALSFMPIAVAVKSGIDFLNDPTRRAVMLGRDKKLEEAHAGTVAGQLELAQDEAAQINAEYDRLAHKMKESADEFVRFVAEVNGRKLEKKNRS